MRLIASLAAFLALLTTIAMPAAAAPSTQAVDPQSVLDASARAMDAAQSMRFSGAIDMNISAEGAPISMSMPMSGAYQAPNRVSMSAQVPEVGVSMEMIIVGDRAWLREGQSAWRAQPVPAGSQASPFGVTHADWFRDFPNAQLTDLGSTYRITSTLDAAQALSSGGYSSTLGSSALPFDFSGPASVAVTIDKATNYLTSMQMELSMTVDTAEISMTMNLTFTDFNSLAIEILPPV
jgi:hypothetical protein